MFLDKEYLSKVFWTQLAVPHFSKVAVADVFCKKGVLGNYFQEHLFHWTPPVAPSEKLKAEAVFGGVF